jgi:hypothetical protein
MRDARSGPRDAETFLLPGHPTGIFQKFDEDVTHLRPWIWGPGGATQADCQYVLPA